MDELLPNPRRDVSLDQVYRDLVFPEPPRDRPYVLLNFVSTLDGQTSLGDGGAAGIGSDTDHRLMRQLRASADGLLHGAGTVRKDNFAPVVPQDLVQSRVERGLTPQPLGALVTSSGRVAPDLRYFSADPPAVFTTSQNEEQLAAALGNRAIVIGAGGDQVDLAIALRILRDRFGIRVLLSEGGPRLAHSLVTAGLLDEIFLTLAPKLGSDRDALRLLEGPRFAPTALPELELIQVLRSQSELFLRYRLPPVPVRLG